VLHVRLDHDSQRRLLQVQQLREHVGLRLGETTRDWGCGIWDSLGIRGLGFVTLESESQISNRISNPDSNHQFRIPNPVPNVTTT